MSENTSPASESAPVAAQDAAKNQDNVSEQTSTKVTEAASKEVKADKAKLSKKEPKQGVRDSRTSKSADGGDEPQADSKPAITDSVAGPQKEAPQSPQRDNQQNVQQGNQQNHANANRGRGRRGRKTGEPNQNQAQQKPVKLNAKAVSKKAWKIFLAEVGEEGLALIGDKEAKELTKRSFRLGEIFQEEEQRRVSLSKVKKVKEPKASRECEPEKSNDVEAVKAPSKKKQVRAKKASKKTIKAEKSDKDQVGVSDRKVELVNDTEKVVKKAVKVDAKAAGVVEQKEVQAPLDLAPSEAKVVDKVE